jgi:hypothetical protein
MVAITQASIPVKIRVVTNMAVRTIPEAACVG